MDKLPVIGNPVESIDLGPDELEAEVQRLKTERKP